MDDSNLKDMQRQLSRMLEQLNRNTGERKIPTLKEYALKYLARKEASLTLAESTKSLIGQQVRLHLVPAFGELALDKVGNDEWLAWVTKTRAENEANPDKKKPLTRFFNARKYLSEILKAAKDEDLIDKCPKLEDPDEDRETGRYLELKEILAIIWAARRPFRFFFYAFWKMGFRPREILQWEWSMFEWSEPGKMFINVPRRISKTRRMRRMPIDPDLTWYLERKKRNGIFVFPNKDPSEPLWFYHAEWNRACERAQVTNAVPYDLRRTAITTWLIRNKSAHYIARLLDTSEEQIRKVYAKDRDDVLMDIFKTEEKEK